jgi:hypothetical protein
MSIVARRGRVVVEPRSRLLRFERPTSTTVAAGAIDTIPNGPDGGTPDPDDPRHELARLALEVVVRTSEPVNVPRAWATVPFAREVDRTRAQLGPIRSRAGLAASFEREATVAVTRPVVPGAVSAQPGPVRVAYAIRWLELGDERARPTWTSIVNGVVVDLLAALGPDGQRIGDSTT